MNISEENRGVNTVINKKNRTNVRTQVFGSTEVTKGNMKDIVHESTAIPHVCTVV